MSEKTSPQPERHPLNAEGPFFVEKDSCITCMAPQHAAPDLLGFDVHEKHCYFTRQPRTPEEVDRAVEAVHVSCVGALHYDGDDPKVLRRLGGWRGAPASAGDGSEAWYSRPPVEGLLEAILWLLREVLGKLMGQGRFP
jgi:hypothetical protein